ncbi:MULTISPECIES: FGGY-family carbohydrate kinase [unclassified Actinomyces]|uniref:FGGY-family carbohydrate kinase n=1 Tax=unclassified Actinomyces TaxID=2609248 RepID=UPI000D59AAB9|nr:MULTISPECIES: FGGY-family carbohydrate kinase [unclassified Actinomyces]RAX20463.1 carbohydrate kinase [Actinomyces sp. Z3]
MARSSRNVLIGLDAGGSYVKATAFDLANGHSATFKRSVGTSHPRPGHNERDAELLWMRAAEVIRSAVEAVPHGRDRVAAVGVTAHGNGLYLVDEYGVPTRASIQASDTRAADLVHRWAVNGVPEQLREQVWNDLWPGQPGPLLAWLARHEPDTLRRSSTALMCGDYLRARLTGTLQGELTTWSCNGLLDSSNLSISDAALCSYEIEDLKRLLPPLVTHDMLVGPITCEAAKLTGLPEGTPVSAGVVDNVALQLGAGVTDGTHILVGAGTWSINQLLVPQDQMTISGALGAVSPYAACLAVPTGMALLIEASATSASTLTWALDHVQRGPSIEADRLGINVYDHVLEAVRDLTPDPNGPMFIPYLDGSRQSAGARGAWLGLSSSDTDYTMLKAVVEGICLEHRRHVGALAAASSPTTPLRLAGGAARSRIWSQLFADVSGRVVEVSPVEEIGAVGAAIIAGVATDEFASLDAGIEHLNPHHETFAPDPERAAFYSKRFARYSRWVNRIEEDPWAG